ncbi:hypothetical protein FBEOM_6117 [Fusarium beomiforme]|uniref:Uncharacterized protein n=1 Tax=Fusarium beomiforme TaxID=44412 RepID=A0A9P5DYC3_9HYPO|nr:hypothetical protein FBEOM_6117 [Fusarium beomiforme]
MPILRKEDTESLVSHILGSSKVFTMQGQMVEEISQHDYHKKHTKNEAEKGAIVGVTITGGIVISVTLFVGFIILKQCITHRPRYKPAIDTGVPSSPKCSVRGSGRQTFNHQMSVPDSGSVYSQRSFGNIAAIPQTEKISAQTVSLLTLSAKAAHTPPFTTLGNYTSVGELYTTDSSSSTPFVTGFSEAKPFAAKPSIDVVLARPVAADVYP